MRLALQTPRSTAFALSAPSRILLTLRQSQPDILVDVAILWYIVVHRTAAVEGSKMNEREQQISRGYAGFPSDASPRRLAAASRPTQVCLHNFC